MNDSELIDALKVQFGWRTDFEVAKFLDIDSTTISSIRTKGDSLGRWQRFKIMDRLKACQVRNLLVRISPAYLGKRIMGASMRGAQRLALDELEDVPPETTDAPLLDAFKVFGGFRTDQEMAERLGIKRNTVSMVRSGKSRLGPLPRLRMLEMIDEQPIDQIERAVESSEYLLQLIQEHDVNNSP
jgi:hypothetical protein